MRDPSCAKSPDPGRYVVCVTAIVHEEVIDQPLPAPQLLKCKSEPTPQQCTLTQVGATPTMESVRSSLSVAFCWPIRQYANRRALLVTPSSNPASTPYDRLQQAR